MANQVGAALQKAGDIEFLEVSILSGAGEYEQQATWSNVDIKLFIGEISIHEDMYGPGMVGSLLMLDAANLYATLGFKGNEWIHLKMKTPTMDDEVALIDRYFKVYSITDRQMISDTGKQSYVIHFCSAEILADMISPMQKTFGPGRVDELVSKIYNERLNIEYPNGKKKPLITGTPCANEIKFVSPNWKPMQCINWLASKAIPSNLKAPTYLFYESNKAYNFMNVEFLFNAAIQNKSYYQDYKYVARSAKKSTDTSYVSNVDDDFKKIENLVHVEDFNYMKNSQNGYYANMLYTLDVITKTYKQIEYKHTEKYFDYYHLEQIKGGTGWVFRPFNKEDAYNPLGHISFYPQHTELFTGVTQNAGDVISKSMQPRISLLEELNNIKLEITVPGRTDIELGAIVHIFYPDPSAKDEGDTADLRSDEKYTGFYLVTAIRHKFTLLSHTMTLEIVKDSLGRRQQK